MPNPVDAIIYIMYNVNIQRERGNAAERYGYGRVSTTGQARKGNSLEDQTERLLAQGITQEHIYTDAYTGTTLTRPKFDELMAVLREGDELVVCKLDRFARTAAEGSLLIKELVDRGVRVNVLNMGIADNTPMGRLMITVLLAFAEYERDMIIERTQAGKAIARQQPGYHEGPRPIVLDADELEECRRAVREKRMSLAEAAARMGVSKRTMTRRFNNHR